MNKRLYSVTAYPFSALSISASITFMLATVSSNGVGTCPSSTSHILQLFGKIYEVFDRIRVAPNNRLPWSRFHITQPVVENQKKVGMF